MSFLIGNKCVHEIKWDLNIFHQHSCRSHVRFLVYTNLAELLHLILLKLDLWLMKEPRKLNENMSEFTNEWICRCLNGKQTREEHSTSARWIRREKPVQWFTRRPRNYRLSDSTWHIRSGMDTFQRWCIALGIAQQYLISLLSSTTCYDWRGRDKRET